MNRDSIGKTGWKIVFVYDSDIQTFLYWQKEWTKQSPVTLYGGKWTVETIWLECLLLLVESQYFVSKVMKYEDRWYSLFVFNRRGQMAETDKLKWKMLQERPEQFCSSFVLRCYGYNVTDAPRDHQRIINETTQTNQTKKKKSNSNKSHAHETDNAKINRNHQKTNYMREPN